MDEQTKKIYSEIIEFSAWDFCEDSLLPGPVLLQAVNMQIKTFSHYYWNMFNRIWDKKVTYEIPMMNVHILDKKVDFPIESRLLFQTEIQSVYDGAMLQIYTQVYQAHFPFSKIAECVWNGVECYHPDSGDWTLGAFPESPRLNKELASLVPATEEIRVENVSALLNRLKLNSVWYGPAIMEYRILQPDCEFGFMGAFMNYTAQIISRGKDNLMQWLKEQKDIEAAPYLYKKTNYQNWKMWQAIKKAFYFDDTVQVQSYYLQANGFDYIKHEIYSKKPHILRNIILESYQHLVE